MGYRSDVAYVIKFADKETLDAFKVSTLFEDKAMREALADCETVESKNIIRFSVESYKWYDSYEEVQAHERLMAAACEEPFKAGVRFTRIGEDYNDVEVRDRGDDMLDAWQHIEIHRSVEFA